MSLKEKFIFNFIDDGRWHYIVDGLKVTLEVTFFAVLLGHCAWRDYRNHSLYIR